jgi:hypothetical protein
MCWEEMVNTVGNKAENMNCKLSWEIDLKGQVKDSTLFYRKSSI